MLDDSFRLVCQLLEGLPAQVFGMHAVALQPLSHFHSGTWVLDPDGKGLVHQFTIDDFTHQLGLLDKRRVYPDAPVVDLLVQGIHLPFLFGEWETA